MLLLSAFSFYASGARLLLPRYLMLACGDVHHPPTLLIHLVRCHRPRACRRPCHHYCHHLPRRRRMQLDGPGSAASTFDVALVVLLVARGT